MKFTQLVLRFFSNAVVSARQQFEKQVVAMLGKKPRILQDRIDAVLTRHELSNSHSASAAVGLSRSQRLQAWTPCVLRWSPNGSAEGICLDHSISGARIRFIYKLTVPAEFRFISTRLGISCDATLVRQDGHDASILFLSGTPSP